MLTIYPFVGLSGEKVDDDVNVDDEGADGGDLPQRTLFLWTLALVIAFWGFCSLGAFLVCCVKTWHHLNPPAPLGSVMTRPRPCRRRAVSMDSYPLNRSSDGRHAEQ